MLLVAHLASKDGAPAGEADTKGAGVLLPRPNIVAGWNVAHVVKLLESLTGDYVFNRVSPHVMFDSLFIDGEFDDLSAVLFLRAVGDMLGLPPCTVFWQVQAKPLNDGRKLLDVLKSVFDAKKLDIVFFEDVECRNGEQQLNALRMLQLDQQ